MKNFVFYLLPVLLLSTSCDSGLNQKVNHDTNVSSFEEMSINPSSGSGIASAKIKTFGFYNFNTKNINSRLLAKLETPSLFSIYRYGDGHHPNSKVRIWITADGKNIEEGLLPGGSKLANLESENNILVNAKEIKIWTDPSQYDINSFIVRGQYNNYDFDGYDLINSSWNLMTKENEIPKTTIIHVGKWDKQVIVRVHFQKITPEGTTAKESIYCILYVNGKPFVDNNNIPVVFYEGNSIDITASQLSIGFHPTVDDKIKGTVKGQYYIKKTDLRFQW